MGKAAAILRREVIAPRLGWSTGVVVLLNLSAVGYGTQLLPKGQAVLVATVGVVSFWISLRVLLRVGRSPNRVWASILFSLHLLNLTVLLVLACFAVLILTGTF